MKPDASAIAHELNQTCAMLVETPAGLSVELNQPKATAIIQRALLETRQSALLEYSLKGRKPIDTYGKYQQEAATLRGWQPIATAPINQSVLVWIPNREHYGFPVYRGLQVDMGTGRRWQINGLAMGRDLGETDSQPTHWMPLPEPPAGQAAQMEVG